MKYFLVLLLFPAISFATTVKFEGTCIEAATGRQQKNRVGFNFSDYPKSLEIMKDEGITQVQLEKPLPSGSGKDRFVVMDRVNGNDFSVNYFGTLYYDSPYFYELRFDYSYDAVNGKLKVKQLQTTYYKGKSTHGNEWSCRLTAY